MSGMNSIYPDDLKKNDIRQFPQCIDIEESILSACMLGAAKEVTDHLKPENFYLKKHQIIMEVISDLVADNVLVNLLTVTERLRTTGKLEEVGGAVGVSRFVDSIPVAGCIDWAVERILEADIRRHIIIEANNISKSAYDEPDFQTLMDLTGRTFQGLDSPTGNGKIFTPYSDLADSEYERWETIGNGGTGIPSGFSKIDYMTGGFHKSDLIVNAARPAMGKTAFGICCVENSARVGCPVAVFSLEMSKSQLWDRQTAKTAKVDSQKFRLGGLEPDDWKKIMEAQGDLCNLKVFIDDTPRQHYREIMRRARWAYDKLGIRMIVIDHLQLIRGDSRERKDLEIGDITASLKGLAKELDIPVILLSQLNRKLEQRDNKRPKLSDLRESGAIEQDSDVVAFIYRDEYYNKATNEPGIAEIYFAKNRHGQTGMIKLKWVDWIASFEDI